MGVVASMTTMARRQAATVLPFVLDPFVALVTELARAVGVEHPFRVVDPFVESRTKSGRGSRELTVIFDFLVSVRVPRAGTKKGCNIFARLLDDRVQVKLIVDIPEREGSTRVLDTAEHDQH